VVTYARNGGVVFTSITAAGAYPYSVAAAFDWSQRGSDERNARIAIMLSMDFARRGPYQRI